MARHLTKFLLLYTLLLSALILSLWGCNSEALQSPEMSGATVVGEGGTVFPFSVIDADGKETVYEVHTDKTTVGEALGELGLIAGEEGPYGLYVKTVCGTTYDYNTHGKYWAFYVNGRTAPKGVDTTPIVPGEYYAFKVE